MQRRMLVSSFLGLALLLAIYLTGVHIAGATVACPTTHVINCQAVLTGPGSVVGGLPLPLWGAAWAILGGVLVWHGARSRWWTAWRFAAAGGLGWAWAHEWSDHHLCLWCSGLQALILAGALLSIAWPSVHAALRHRVPAFWSHKRLALATGLLSSAAFVANQWRLGTDRWGWVIVIAALWGFAMAWLMALWLTRRPRQHRTATVVTTLSAAPLSVGTSVLATACAGGVCSVGAGAVGAPLVALGLSGLLSASTMALMPLILQGLFAGIGLVIAWEWTVSSSPGGSPSDASRSPHGGESPRNLREEVR